MEDSGTFAKRGFPRDGCRNEPLRLKKGGTGMKAGDHDLYPDTYEAREYGKNRAGKSSILSLLLIAFAPFIHRYWRHL